MILTVNHTCRHQGPFIFLVTILFFFLSISSARAFNSWPTKRKISSCQLFGTTQENQEMHVSVYIAVTVDGFIATPEGDVGFLDTYQQPPSPENGQHEKNKYDFETFMSQVDVLIMGRKSFEKVISFGADMWAYGDTRVVVRTRQPTSMTLPSFLSSEQVAFSKESPSELLNNLTSQGYRHAYIDGGQTVQHFLAEGLVHKLILTRVPLLLGNGISLFGNLPHPIALEHEETLDLGNGLITSSYQISDSLS